MHICTYICNRIILHILHIFAYFQIMFLWCLYCMRHPFDLPECLEMVLWYTIALQSACSNRFTFWPSIPPFKAWVNRCTLYHPRDTNWYNVSTYVDQTFNLHLANGCRSEEYTSFWSVHITFLQNYIHAYIQNCYQTSCHG